MNFKSVENKSLLFGIINKITRKKFNVMINDEFNDVMNDIMTHALTQCGKKNAKITNEEHLTNLNKKCIDEAIKYIGNNISYFPKLQPSGEDIQPPENKLPLPNQNIHKNTDDMFNQMQNDRGNNFNRMQQINFQQPTQINGQPTADQALMLALEQRKKDTPYVNNSTHPDTSDSQGPNGQINNGGTLMNMLLQTPVAIQRPELIPALIKEIMQMSHLVDLMNKDPIAFQQQVTNPQFLQMMVTQIQNKSDPKMKPMSLNDTDDRQQIPPMPPNGGDPTNVIDYTKMIPMYKTQELDVNQMNIHIPPSEQLVNNVLPNLDDIHLINYDLSLDFRNDLENVTKNQYAMKFTQFGNISKVELSSCIIPENDMLMNEPYIFLKIEELGGRCYTSNHEVTFGKLILHENKNGYLHYVPDRESCIQSFSQPTLFNKFTVSFINFNGKYINLKEISIKKTFKLRKSNKIKFFTLYKHKLSRGEIIEVHIYQNQEIEMYEIQVEEVVDDYNFIVDNCFEKLSDHICILRQSVNCSFRFKLHEINWNLLTKRNVKNAQLIKLSQLINDRRKETLKTIGDDRDIINYVKSKEPGLVGFAPTKHPLPQFGGGT